MTYFWEHLKPSQVFLLFALLISVAKFFKTDVKLRTYSSALSILSLLLGLILQYSLPKYWALMLGVLYSLLIVLQLYWLEKEKIEVKE